MIKYNSTTQKKLEDLFDHGGYTVRYEKGNFNSGYCILEKKRVVVINKFHSQESKINSLIEILAIVKLDTTHFTESMLQSLKEFSQQSVANELF